MRTPKKVIDKRYEDKHKAERKARSATFGTSMPRGEYEEIIAFLEKYKITKVELIREGYEALKAEVKVHGTLEP